ncbi:unnamed protein product [Closterium sp. NIES-64]|nr:unnamed protein product [Closterium sp. NIES-64]
MGLRCRSSSHDRNAADPYSALREPMDSAGKGDPMAWGSARFGREATDPPPKHTGGHSVHVKIEGATKRHEPSAANDGVGGGVWANALGECGGGVEGSTWDVRESRGDGGDAKMDPATKEGRGESMGTPGASSRPDLAGGKTVEQLMRELAQRDREIAALKARAGSKGPVKPCTPPSRPPPLASLSSGPSAGGLDPGMAPESPATVDVPVRRTRGMPTPKLLKSPFKRCCWSHAGACGAEIAAALAVNPTRPTPSIRRSPLPSLSHPSPSSSRAPPDGAASLMRGHAAQR